MQGKQYRNTPGVENPPGITRRTLVHNDQAMLCHFSLTKGSVIPIHSHAPVQIGYVISGCVRFKSGRCPDGFLVRGGDSYVFDSEEEHGAEAIEDSVYIEVFTPSRPEYV